MSNHAQKKDFICCEKCGKRLIERLPDGMFKFIFGGKQNPSPVEMFIYGSVKMRCLRKHCGHWNKFSFIPSIF